MKKYSLQRAIKRASERLLAGGGLVAAAPAMAVVSVAIRTSMGSPVLFRQNRTGEGGRSFELLKFRTLTDACDAQGNPLPDGDRLTAVGEFLRSTSLDELPQLINVLRGEMSLVGPRPLLERYLPRYSQDQCRRHNVLPGITGWAQVKGRNALDWESKFELDLWYVDHWSLFLDMRIILMTVKTLIRPKGVSADGHATMPEFMGREDPEAS